MNAVRDTLKALEADPNATWKQIALAARTLIAEYEAAHASIWEWLHLNGLDPSNPLTEPGDDFPSSVQKVAQQVMMRLPKVPEETTDG